MKEPKLIKQIFDFTFPVGYPEKELDLIACFVELKKDFKVSYDPEANSTCLFIKENGVSISINRSGHVLLWVNISKKETQQLINKLWVNYLKKNVLSQT